VWFLMLLLLRVVGIGIDIDIYIDIASPRERQGWSRASLAAASDN
jgi:hypothetical protein